MAETLRDIIAVDTADCVVLPYVMLLTCSAESPVGHNEFELEIVSVVDPTPTSEVHFLIGVVGGTRIWSNEGAIVICGLELDAVLALRWGSLLYLICWWSLVGLSWVWWWPFR